MSGTTGTASRRRKLKRIICGLPSSMFAECRMPIAEPVPSHLLWDAMVLPSSTWPSFTWQQPTSMPHSVRREQSLSLWSWSCEHSLHSVIMCPTRSVEVSMSSTLHCRHNSRISATPSTAWPHQGNCTMGPSCLQQRSCRLEWIGQAKCTRIQALSRSQRLGGLQGSLCDHSRSPEPHSFGRPKLHRHRWGFTQCTTEVLVQGIPRWHATPGELKCGNGRTNVDSLHQIHAKVWGNRHHCRILLRQHLKQNCCWANGNGNETQTINARIYNLWVVHWCCVQSSLLTLKHTKDDFFGSKGVFLLMFTIPHFVWPSVMQQFVIFLNCSINVFVTCLSLMCCFHCQEQPSRKLLVSSFMLELLSDSSNVLCGHCWQKLSLWAIKLNHAWQGTRVKLERFVGQSLENEHHWMCIVAWNPADALTHLQSLLNVSFQLHWPNAKLKLDANKRSTAWCGQTFSCPHNVILLCPFLWQPRFLTFVIGWHVGHLTLCEDWKGVSPPAGPLSSFFFCGLQMTSSLTTTTNNCQFCHSWIFVGCMDKHGCSMFASWCPQREEHCNDVVVLIVVWPCQCHSWTLHWWQKWLMKKAAQLIFQNVLCFRVIHGFHLERLRGCCHNQQLPLATGRFRRSFESIRQQ